MIKIRSISEIENNEIVELYDNENNFLGNIESGIQFLDICIQIKESNLVGYYIGFKGEKIYFESDGRIYFKHDRPFTSYGNLIRKLI